MSKVIRLFHDVATPLPQVMMLEIAQKVQQFLHKHDRPHVSLYDEMLQRQRQKEREEEKRLEAEKEAQRIREEEEVCVCVSV